MYRFFVMLFLILILLNTCAGCTYMVAKETVKVIDMALDKSPNPEKKKKILEKKKLKQNKAKEFYCSKVKDEEKCGSE
jgi:protein associated with RNAse G/E